VKKSNWNVRNKKKMYNINFCQTFFNLVL
jgi:hypothetical protein